MRSRLRSELFAYQSHKTTTSAVCLERVRVAEVDLALAVGGRVKMKIDAEGTWLCVGYRGCAVAFNKIEIGPSNLETMSDARTSGACVKRGDCSLAEMWLTVDLACRRWFRCFKGMEDRRLHELCSVVGGERYMSVEKELDMKSDY